MFSVSLSMLRRLLEEKVSLRAELCQVEEQIQIAEYQISALQNTWYVQQTRRLFILTGKTRGGSLTTLYLQHSEVRTLQAGQLERTIERLRPLQAEPTSLCHLNNKQAILPNMTLGQWEYRHWNSSDNKCPSLKCIRPRQLGGQLFISRESVIAIRLSSIKVSPV